jgi:hypothetical protein
LSADVGQQAGAGTPTGPSPRHFLDPRFVSLNAMPTQPLRIFTPLAFAVLVATAGCGKTWTQNNSVEGTVKFEGAPVPNVTVEFVPDDPKVQGPTSTGTTDDKGHFQLTCANGKPGAVIGKHNVVILVGRTETGAPASHVAIPGVYKVAAQTPAQVNVTAETHSYDIELKRNAVARK